MMSYLKLEILRMVRNRRYLIFSLGFPLGFYLLYTKIFAGAMPFGGTAWAAYFMVSMAAFGAMGAAMSVGGARLAAERASGWTRQLRVTPLPAATYLLVKAAAAEAVALPAVLLVAAAGVVVNHVTLPWQTWLSLLGLLWIGTLLFAALGILLGYLLDVDSAYGGTLAIYFALSMLGGLWMPLDIMPNGIQHLARFLPSYHLASLGWDVLAGKGIKAMHLVVLAVYTLAFGIIAGWLFRRDEVREWA